MIRRLRARRVVAHGAQTRVYGSIESRFWPLPSLQRRNGCYGASIPGPYQPLSRSPPVGAVTRPPKQPLMRSAILRPREAEVRPKEDSVIGKVGCSIVLDASLQGDWAAARRLPRAAAVATALLATFERAACRRFVTTICLCAEDALGVWELGVRARRAVGVPRRSARTRPTDRRQSGQPGTRTSVCERPSRSPATPMWTARTAQCSHCLVLCRSKPPLGYITPGSQGVIVRHPGHERLIPRGCLARHTPSRGHDLPALQLDDPSGPTQGATGLGEIS
jgi:hypothetical protein